MDPFEHYLRLAEQFSVVPPFDPSQVQFHGPLPVTLEVLPALQRFDVGAFSKLSPFADPHAPFTSRLAEQLALEPPFTPSQVHFHAPFPVTVETIPAPQRFDVGSVTKSPLFAEPQAPFISIFAEQFAVAPPLDPEQVQSHCPLFVTEEGVPA
jgi:hypothetical protein